MKCFITGITGTLGTHLTELLLKDGHEVVGFSRDELKQQNFKRAKDITLYLGDVRDIVRVKEATRGVEIIFHLAALKHVDKLEANPEEAYKTNISGTDNVLHAQRSHGISRVVMASTDKAAYPVNAYGFSKAAAERLVLRNSNNVVCRYGNVLASRGSIVESLVRTLKNESTAYLTDPNMTRFWITAHEAAHFVLSKGMGKHGGLHIPPMKAAVLSLLTQIIADCLNVKSYEMKQIGVRPGEKTAECLRTEYEGEAMYSNTAPQFTEEELFKIVKPIVMELAS